MVAFQPPYCPHLKLQLQPKVVDDDGADCDDGGADDADGVDCECDDWTAAAGVLASRLPLQQLHYGRQPRDVNDRDPD